MKNSKATYTLYELIWRIKSSENQDELNMYQSLVDEERQEYDLFELALIDEAIRVIRIHLRARGYNYYIS